MNTFEATATVEDQGRVVVAGVPFAPGTRVEVKISTTPDVTDNAEAKSDAEVAAARARMRELFATIKGFRNTPRIPREELYDRGSLR
jgi:hypothetical protein